MTIDYLQEPLLADDLVWLEDNASKFIPVIKRALADGKTPDDIYRFYMSIAEHRKPFWIRVKHAAMELQRLAKE